MDLSKYRALYVSETQENLETLARRLVELEADPAHRDHIDTVFRLFHSIKGMSGTMGYQPMFELAHALEDLMEQVREGRRQIDAEIIDLLLGGVDRMTQWVADVDVERLPLTLDAAARALTGRVADLLGRPKPTVPMPRVTTALPTPVGAPGDLVVDVESAPGSPDAGVRGFLLYRKLKRLGEVVSSHPPVETLQAGQLEGPLRLVLRTPHTRARIEQFVRLVPDWVRVDVRAYEAPPGPAPAATEPAARAVEADELLFTGDLALFDDLPTEAPDEVADLDEPAASASAETPAADSMEGDPGSRIERRRAEAAAIVRAPRPARTIRVRTDWLDTLLDRVGDLLIVNQRLWNLNQERPQPAMTQALGQLSRTLTALHGDALSVRMTPMSVLTSRLPRVVRDLGRQVDKKATLVVHGDDQQLDRAIIEGLDAPLTHLLRNAVEHGIESPEARAAAGKRPVGLLTLECRRVRDEIVVELQDDGGGIDRERLVERAADLGLLDRARAVAMAERDLTRLVCLPGLSARDRAGALAGRGVGMDVVQDAINGLGGRVEVTSEAGVGTTVRLRLPRTPGISKLLLVEADAQVFGLPLGRIVKTDQFDADTAERERGALYVDHGDERLRLHALRHLLGFPRRPLEGSFPGVVFAHPTGPFVLGVDRVVGQQDAVIKPLGPLLERIEGLLGVTIDSVGEPVFVVDVNRFIAVG